MLVKLNDEEICVSKAEYGPYETVAETDTKWSTITSMSICDTVIPVKKGDKLEISAFWDKQKHPL
jgi:hypothetical protein